MRLDGGVTYMLAMVVQSIVDNPTAQASNGG